MELNMKGNNIQFTNPGQGWYMGYHYYPLDEDYMRYDDVYEVQTEYDLLNQFGG